MRFARFVLVALALACAGCTDYGVDIDPTFTEAERADIYAAIDAWEQSTPRWRAAVGPHVIHLRRVAVLPENWSGATTRSTRTVRLLPFVVVGPLFRRLIVHELGHVAGLGQRVRATPVRENYDRMITIVTPLRNTVSGITSRFMTKTIFATVIAAFATACTVQTAPAVTHRTIDSGIGGYSGYLIVECPPEAPHMTNDTTATVTDGRIYAERAVSGGRWEYDVAPDSGRVARLRIELYCDALNVPLAE